MDTSGSNASDMVINTLFTSTFNKTLYGGDIVESITTLEKLNQVNSKITESQLQVSKIPNNCHGISSAY